MRPKNAKVILPEVSVFASFFRFFQQRIGEAAGLKNEIRFVFKKWQILGFDKHNLLKLDDGDKICQRKLSR